MPPRIQVRDELTTGLQAESRLDDPRPHYEVTWIQWDSGFRQSGLRLGDHIIAVDGKPIIKPATIEEEQRTSYKAIGQYAEHQRWQELGLADGAPLTLTIERPSSTGEGWERATAAGQIRATRAYYDDTDHETLGPGGPPASSYGGPDGQWRYWYENQIIKAISRALRIWTSTSFDSRREMEMLREEEPRIQRAVEQYPGPFATALLADFRAAIDCLQGRVHPLTDADLRYRRDEEEKRQHVAQLAQQAWAAFQEAHRAELLPALPAEHPVRDDRGAITGKLALLPPLGDHDWYGEIDRYSFGARAGERWFFVDVYSAASSRMREAAYRYARLVHPNIDKTYTMLARILPDPRIVYAKGGSLIGLGLEPIAALVGEGGAMFVDLTQANDGISQFAGEAELLRPRAPATGPDSTPRQVMESFFLAIQDGDETSWRSCFADWDAIRLDDGRVRIYPYSGRVSAIDWEGARRRVLNDVYGAIVSWVGEPRDLTTGREFEGAPHLQEVEVWLAHIGLFDGQYRTFTSPFLHRQWRLQRLNGSPWRITDQLGF